MRSVASFTSITLSFAALRGALAGFDSKSNNNLAVYWGQNSQGGQQSLSHYCSQYDQMDIIPLAFTTIITDQFNKPELNFANQAGSCTVFAGTQTLHCPTIAQDIVSCQRDHGKTIVLSIGGATYSEGGFTTKEEAVAAAQMMWKMFGPRDSSSNALRPFDDAAIDGFDFDFESPVSNMAPFANELRRLMDTKPDGKTRYLTAAPQCPYPDVYDEQILNGGVSVDAVFVQFYNNYCGLQSFVGGGGSQNNFNFQTWDNWAKTVSANKNVKVFLGVPASSSAAGSGYKAAADLQPIIKYCKGFSSFGGVMMWDASQAAANGNFLQQVKSALKSSSVDEDGLYGHPDLELEQGPLADETKSTSGMRWGWRGDREKKVAAVIDVELELRSV